MLYLYYGSDEREVRARVQAAVAALVARAPEASVERITAEAEALDGEMLMAAQGLFYVKRMVVFDFISEKKELWGELLKNIKAFAESEHVFFVLEGALRAADEKKLKKYAAKTLKIDSKKDAVRKENDFALANAFGARNTQEAWVLYRKALRRGAAPEAIHGMLFWKAKDMMLKKRLGAYSEGEVRTLIGELAVLPTQARRQSLELEYALEQFLLSR